MKVKGGGVVGACLRARDGASARVTLQLHDGASARVTLQLQSLESISFIGDGIGGLYVPCVSCVVHTTPGPIFTNLKPQTPNPKPQTPNPKPQTPNPNLMFMYARYAIGALLDADGDKLCGLKPGERVRGGVRWVGV